MFEVKKCIYIKEKKRKRRRKKVPDGVRDWSFVEMSIALLLFTTKLRRDGRGNLDRMQLLGKFICFIKLPGKMIIDGEH
jgi:hypothetical protein